MHRAVPTGKYGRITNGAVAAKSGCKGECAVVFALEAQEDSRGEKNGSEHSMKGETN
jgi:hypothetical protein